ncbi:MAG: toxin glutamine deamidase domain-containing protein [Alphaproteobacteria bacterium]
MESANLQSSPELHRLHGPPLAPPAEPNPVEEDARRSDTRLHYITLTVAPPPVNYCSADLSSLPRPYDPDPLVILGSGLIYHESEIPRHEAFIRYRRFASHNANFFTLVGSTIFRNLALLLTNNQIVIDAAEDLGARVGDAFLFHRQHQQNQQTAIYQRGPVIPPEVVPRPRGPARTRPPNYIRTGIRTAQPLLPLAQINLEHGRRADNNCAAIATALDMLFRGFPTVVERAPIVGRRRLPNMSPEELARQWYPNRTFAQKTESQIRRDLLSAGHGATGIVWAEYRDGETIRGSGGHFFNAINWHGTVHFVDAQGTPDNRNIAIISNPGEDYRITAFLRTR